MQYFRVFVLSLLFTITGCASSSDLEKQAKHHDKAGDYYESIGQSATAREERDSANKNRDDAGEIFTFLSTCFIYLQTKENSKVYFDLVLNDLSIKAQSKI